MNMQPYQGIIGGSHRANVWQFTNSFGKIPQKKGLLKKLRVLGKLVCTISNFTQQP
jgi:hypothetical protein